MSSFAFKPAILKVWKNDLDLETADLRALLVTDGGLYTPSRDTEFIDTGGANDIVDDEATSGDIATYARQTLANMALSLQTDGSGNPFVRFTSDNVDFGALGVSSGGKKIKAMVIYVFNAADTAAETVAWCEFAVLKETDGVSFLVTAPTEGWFKDTLLMP